MFLSVRYLSRPDHPKCAFTLVEVVLAIALLSLVLTMVAGLVITGIRVNTANVHQLQATYLAQEGLEMVRNMRDNNWWQNGAFDKDLAAGLYRVSFNESGVPWKLTPITDVSTESYLYEDMINQVPVLTDNYAAGTLSSFRRFIEIAILSDGILEVASTVSWDERGLAREVVLSIFLTDWKGGPL